MEKICLVLLPGGDCCPDAHLPDDAAEGHRAAGMSRVHEQTAAGPCTESGDCSGPRGLRHAGGQRPGFGVRAMSDLRAGSLICEDVGEALERQHFEKRRGTRSSKSYFLRADDVVIDAARRGNTSRFVNHSCSPSAEVQLWKVPTADGLSVRTAVAIIARHFIKKGSEITYDYRFECFEDALQTQCLCGASDCRLIWGKKK